MNKNREKESKNDEYVLKTKERGEKFYLKHRSNVTGENTVNGDHSDAHHSTFSQSSKEVRMHSVYFYRNNG